jgi:hypothetical protein
MQNINSINDLREAILLMESRQSEEEIILREQFQLTYESLKPLSLIKSTLKEASESREIKNNIFNTSVGMTAGYLSKIIFERTSKNPFKKLFGNILMFGITNIVTRNTSIIKNTGKRILEIIREKHPESFNGTARLK